MARHGGARLAASLLLVAFCLRGGHAISQCQAVLASSAPYATAAFIDADTPGTACVRQAPGLPGDLVLTFSDEFNAPGRGFGAAAADSKWTAVDLWYMPTGDEEVYKPDAVTTRDGSLVITTTREATSAPAQNTDGSVFTVTKPFKSGMIQGWNKACFRGGYFEARIKLPGNSYHSGLWPAFWALGNLGRAGYTATTEGLWPLSYSNCSGSANVPWSSLQPQRVSACEDRPPPAERARLGLVPGQGRGAPEFDILEVSVASGNTPESYTPPHVAQSLQVAPVLPPGLNFADPAYYASQGLPQGFNLPGAATQFASKPTQWFGPLGPPESAIPRAGTDFNDCISAQSTLNDAFFNDFHTYSAYWEPGEKLYFYIDGVPTFQLEKSALAAACNGAGQCIGDRLIPEEPMYLILNVALSNAWSAIHPDLPMPAEMLVDYVRVWQRPEAADVGCSPAEAPTEQYIACNRGKFTMAEGDDALIKGACPS